MEHFIGHQQALIKNNICIAVLVFNEHDEELMHNTFSAFDYDLVVNLCEIQKEAILGSSWDGEVFHIKMHESWFLGEDLKWHPPVLKPADNFLWDEENQSWVEFNSIDNTAV